MPPENRKLDGSSDCATEINRKQIAELVRQLVGVVRERRETEAHVAGDFDTLPKDDVDALVAGCRL